LKLFPETVREKTISISIVEYNNIVLHLIWLF